ncbi:hypothetical protein [Polyangium spumosum]|uniref:Disintegrin domain-containing protein n=1 Tax=Polyangium spumosum TaxID=889282 RepID=A0A6N7PXC7_9BACT|nr:hypothetical protein [Polyangium spumosum]MRG94744.1 hypothetical protein [Polyangium spumosum]
MREAWSWTAGVLVGVLGMAGSPGCLSLSTSEGGQGGAGGVGGGPVPVTGQAATGQGGSSSSGAGGEGGGGSNLGDMCITGADCTSGFCADGVCCDSDCGGDCQSCARPGYIGTCSNLPAGEEDQPTCTLTSACDGNGACKSKNGQPCTSNAECLSGKCEGAPGNKTCAP